MTTSATRVQTLPRDQITGAAFLPSLIGFYFGLRVCITFLFFQSAPQTGAMVSVALNLFLLVPVAIYAIGPAATSLSSTLKLPTIRLVFVLLTLALISILWSDTASKTVALAYWSDMAADVFVVVLLSRTDGASQTAEALLKGYIWGVFLLCIVAWCAPAMQDLRLGDDEFLTPNIIGFECAFAALLCQYFAPQALRWKWLGALLALTLLRSLSKTSIAAFLLAEAFYLLRTKALSRAVKFKLAAATTLVTIAFSGLLARYYTVYTNTSNQVETLTGRTSIWIVTSGFILEKPWLGHGFHSFRNVVPSFGAFQPWHAHNELLQTLFTYGALGVTLVVMLYLSFYRTCRRNLNHPFAQTGIALMLLVLIRGLADTERFDLSFPLWTLTAASLLLSTNEART